MSLPAADRFAEVEAPSAEALRLWLSLHHAQGETVWLVTWKRGDPRFLHRWDVLDECLCWGWIDGAMRKRPDGRTMQMISPRRHDRWAATYRARAERLLAEGRMAPPGLAAIERARAAGTWEAMADVDALLVPPDLDAALGDARAAWDALPPSYRRNVLRWLALARRAPTRAARVAGIAAATAEGRRLPLM